MGRGYRKRRRTASPAGVEVAERGDGSADRIVVALSRPVAEVIAGVGEEIERLTGEAGLLIMKAVMDAEVESLAGPKGRHDPRRQATRWTSQGGYVVLAGKKLNVTRPRVRTVAGTEVGLRSYERFQSPARRTRSITRKLLNGISTRKYERAVEDFTDGYGISRSAVSRELIAATSGSLRKLCERRVDEIGRLVVLMIDGKEIDGECVVTALGVDSTGKKHVLGLVQGSTENSTVVQHLLDDLVERGLDTTQRMLIVLDGSKALRKAVRKTFGDGSPVQRCQVHKRRNVKEHLPPEYQAGADQRIRTAYAMKDFASAKAQLEKTVDWLEGINPSAAGSLREGLDETLTLHRLGLPVALRKSFETTNLIESAFSVAEEVGRRVKRWRGGDMRLRWTAAGLLTAEGQFRRVRGCKLMPKLLAALDAGAGGIAEGSEAA
jgi:transposase-like protein